jgi:RNA polymerase sigma-70 factor (ECF subfamily)
MSSPADPADLRSLLAHERPLRALCRALVQERSDGEDLEQETWLAALMGPPERAPRAWLRRVARNLAARRERSEWRRARREARAAKSEALPDSAELVQRAELFQALLAEVVGLEEPYRSTVMLRYFEGRTTQEIAAAHAITESNVHVRLHRGLRELRSRLDRRGGRERWFGACAALGGISEVEGASWGVLLTMSTLRSKLAGLLALVLLALGLCGGVVWLCAPLLRSDADAAALVAAGGAAGESSLEAREPSSSALRSTASEVGLEGEATLGSMPQVLQVRVVDAVTRRAVPRAQLYWLDEKSHLPLSLSWHFGESRSSLDSLVRAQGSNLSANDEGIAELPRFARRALVGAEKDGCWGWLELHPGIEEPIEVAIAPYREVTVEVVDERGSPVASAPVQLVTPDDVAYRGSCSHMGIWKARTGTDGLATLRFSRTQLRGFRTALSGSRTRLELIASCAVVGRERDGVRFDVDALPASPIRLQRPPSGTLIVDVVDDEGRPLSETLLIGCSYSFAEPRREGTGTFGGPSLVAQDGRVVFESIGLDLDLQIGCSSDSVWSIPNVELAGPRRAGEVVHAVLRAAGRFPLLKGRVVEPSGTALSLVELHAVLRRKDVEWSVSQPLLLDTEGRFTFPITWRPDEGASLLLELVRWERYDGNQMPSGPMATCEISYELLGTGGDVGDLVLCEQPLSFAGRVVDDRGTPINGAQLRVVRVLRGENDEFERHATRILERSDARGNFACRGELAGASVEIHVSAEGHGPRVFGPFASGAFDLELVLPRGGEIRGRLLLDSMVPPEELWVYASSEQVGHAVPQTQPSADGSFVLRGVSPGARDISVYWSRRLQLASVPDVEVRSAEITNDPRLQPLDLRERLEPLELEIVETRGAPLEGIVLVLESSTFSPLDMALSLDAEQRTTVLVPRDVETLRVEARACVPVVLASRAGRQRVELRRGPSVRLAAEAPLPRVDAGRTLLRGSIHVDEPDADDAWRAACAKLDAIELDARGAALVDLPRAGRYRIEWEELGGHVTHFQVEESASETVVRFGVPWEKLGTEKG